MYSNFFEKNSIRFFNNSTVKGIIIVVGYLNDSQYDPTDRHQICIVYTQCDNMTLEIVNNFQNVIKEWFPLRTLEDVMPPEDLFENSKYDLKTYFYLEIENHPTDDVNELHKIVSQHSFGIYTITSNPNSHLHDMISYDLINKIISYVYEDTYNEHPWITNLSLYSPIVTYTYFPDQNIIEFHINNCEKHIGKTDIEIFPFGPIRGMEACVINIQKIALCSLFLCGDVFHCQIDWEKMPELDEDANEVVVRLCTKNVPINCTEYYLKRSYTILKIVTVYNPDNITIFSTNKYYYHVANPSTWLDMKLSYCKEHLEFEYISQLPYISLSKFKYDTLKFPTSFPFLVTTEIYGKEQNYNYSEGELLSDRKGSYMFHSEFTLRVLNDTFEMKPFITQRSSGDEYYNTAELAFRYKLVEKILHFCCGSNNSPNDDYLSLCNDIIPTEVNDPILYQNPFFSMLYNYNEPLHQYEFRLFSQEYLNEFRNITIVKDNERYYIRFQKKEGNTDLSLDISPSLIHLDTDHIIVEKHDNETRLFVPVL